MWGEIDPPVKVQATQFEKDERPKLTEEPEKCSLKHSPEHKQEQLDSEVEEVSASVSALLEAVVQSGSLVKSQQIGEAELTPQERRRELLLQYRSKPLVFLERYHTCLKPQHLTAFEHVTSDPRAQHYSKVIQRRAAGNTDRTRVRNHRYAALRALQREGHYFSEEQMRKREPLLYEHYIGQYLTDEEVLERSQEAMLDGGAGAGGCTGGLASLLLNSYDERLIQDRLQQEQEREDEVEEEEEEDDVEETEQKTWEPNSEEKSLLREEFISQMHQRFLDGKDKDFNYSEVDENPDYDNLDIVNRDEEEKYFDEDEEEEEEEEFMTE
ncbi:coiled-coil domain-containing protein 97 isoform 2-T2 [Synchiropus picturatus]